MASLRALACGLVVFWGLPSVTAARSEPIAVAPFRSLELRNGSHAFLRYGPTPRVTFLKGNPDETQVTIVSGDRLVVDKCKSKCTGEYELEIEIVTPELGSITLAHGGWIQSRGSFPRQAAIDVTVDNGGTIDIRSMSVANVKASVLSGGRILTTPLTAMAATVVQGGNITYWGDARVTQSIEHGGVIEKGDPSEADTPLPTEPLRSRRP
jgi:hypothetical protein